MIISGVISVISGQYLVGGLIGSLDPSLIITTLAANHIRAPLEAIKAGQKNEEIIAWPLPP